MNKIIFNKFDFHICTSNYMYWYECSSLHVNCIAGNLAHCGYPAKYFEQKLSS